MKSDYINDLAAALTAAQAEFPSINKESQNPFFRSKYADLATVVKTAAPIITKHGLAVSQFVSVDGGGASLLTTYLLHQSGQYIAHDMPLLLPKADPQGQGSAITYARRYSYMSVLGLVADEDDDAQRASNKPAEAYSKPKATLIHPDKLKALKEALRAAELVGDKATEFSRFVIDKDKPENDEDVDKLLEALEVGK